MQPFTGAERMMGLIVIIVPGGPSMGFRLFANPMKLDIQIALTIYDAGRQTTQRHFFLRNLLGESESEQVAPGFWLRKSVWGLRIYLAKVKCGQRAKGLLSAVNALIGAVPAFNW
jgi:hypothetical protein